MIHRLLQTRKHIVKNFRKLIPVWMLRSMMDGVQEMVLQIREVLKLIDNTTIRSYDGGGHTIAGLRILPPLSGNEVRLFLLKMIS